MINKPALYYAIVRQGYNTYGGFEIFKVTSEKHNLIFGSFDTGYSNGNKVSKRDIICKFEILEQAKEKFEGIKTIWKIFEVQLKQLEIQSFQLKKTRDFEIKMFVEN